MTAPRRIRRPPARPAARQRDPNRRVQRKVLAAGAAILLAGAAATFLLEQAVLAPAGGVSADSALPVYSAVGQRTDDVSFWPWLFYAEQAGQEAVLIPVEDDADLEQPLLEMSAAFLESGVELDTTGMVLRSLSDASSNCLYIQDLPVLYTPPQGGVQTLSLELGVGVSSDPALAFGTSLSFLLKPEAAPDEAQLEAAYRQVLLDLYFDCGAAGWLLEGMMAYDLAAATPPPADDQAWEATASQPPASDPLAGLDEEARQALVQAADLPFTRLLEQLSYPMGDLMGVDPEMLLWPVGLGPDTSLWPLENSPDPLALAAGTLSEEDTRKLEQRLQQQYAEYGMELQIVTLSDSVLVLFSGTATLGFYYSPVLGCYNGVAAQ